MKLFIFLFCLLTTIETIESQNWVFGVGYEVHRSSLKSRSNETFPPYDIPFGAKYGMAGLLSIEYKLGRYLNLYTNPSLGYQLMSWNDGKKDTKLKMNYLNFNLGSRLSLNHIVLGFEVGYSRYFEMLKVRNKDKFDFSNFLINKNILTTSFIFGYKIYKESFIFLKTTNSHNDLFATVGFNNLGQSFMPIFVRPNFVSLGIKYCFDFNKKNVNIF